MSKLKCCGCKKRFDSTTMLTFNNSTFHSYDCAIDYARKKSAKDAKAKVRKDKQDHTAAKRRLKDNDKSFQTKKAQTEFNRYIRIRDKSRGCISCRKPFNHKYDAGHFRSTGGNPELRFNELNNNGQCVHCNQHLSGNLVDYRINLIAKIGKEKVELLEGPHEPKRYTIENLKTIQKWFKRKTKRLENADT